jgi:hypothetical protein
LHGFPAPSGEKSTSDAIMGVAILRTLEMQKCVRKRMRSPYLNGWAPVVYLTRASEVQTMMLVRRPWRADATNFIPASVVSG